MLPSIRVKLSKRCDSIQWREGQAALIFHFMAGVFRCGWQNVWPPLAQCSVRPSSIIMDGMNSFNGYPTPSGFSHLEP
jgi:hypothetical protein